MDMMKSISSIKNAICFTYGIQLAGKSTPPVKRLELFFDAKLAGSKGKCVAYRVSLSGKKDFSTQQEQNQLNP